MSDKIDKRKEIFSRLDRLLAACQEQKADAKVTVEFVLKGGGVSYGLVSQQFMVK